MDYERIFKDKRVIVLGLGLLGRGVGDTEFLAKCGARVVATDKKTEAELAESVEKLKQYPNVSFKLGGHSGVDFSDCDMVLKAAGVRPDSPEVAAARAAHVPVVMSTALFAKYAMENGVRTVGVTGTRGKTTVAHMIFHVLKQAGKRVYLGGNVRGVSTLAMLPEVQAGDIAVLELDSWQLQGFGDLKISPNISVFTNLLPDHMNYYGGDMDAYFSDKANIFRYQKLGDVLICSSSVLDRVRGARPALDPIVPDPIPRSWKLRVVGEHNRHNAALAAAALHALELTDEQIQEGLETFEAVEGRLQFVRELNGVKIYNDNNATTPEATVAAIRSLGKNMTLIVGGSDKGLSLDELVSIVKQNVSHVILLTHEKYEGSTRLGDTFQKEGVVFEEADSLEDALEAALSHTENETALFSPAFASFGMFKNEYDRNDQFLNLVRQAGGA